MLLTGGLYRFGGLCIFGGWHLSCLVGGTYFCWFGEWHLSHLSLLAKKKK